MSFFAVLRLAFRADARQTPDRRKKEDNNRMIKYYVNSEGFTKEFQDLISVIRLIAILRIRHVPYTVLLGNISIIDF